MNNSIKLKFSDCKEYFFKSKKYCIIYLLLICMAVITLFNLENYQHPKFEIFSIIIVSIFSIFSLVYYIKMEIKSFINWLLLYCFYLD